MQLVENIKKIAVNAVEAEKPVKIYIGTVKKISRYDGYDYEDGITYKKGDIVVQINPKMELTPDKLIVTETVRDMLWGYLGGMNYIKYAIQNRTKSELEVGDKVLLMRVQGGQKFIVIDRVSKEDSLDEE